MIHKATLLANIATVFLYCLVAPGCGDLGPCCSDPSPGRKWRWSADGATGLIGTNTVAVVGSSGYPMHKDHCLCINNHALVLAYLENNAELGETLDEILEDMEANTVDACADRADAMNMLRTPAPRRSPPTIRRRISKPVATHISTRIVRTRIHTRVWATMKSEPTRPGWGSHSMTQASMSHVRREPVS